MKAEFSKHWKPALAGVLIVLVAFTVGRCTAGHSHASVPESEASSLKPQASLWTCSMHPQIKLPHPGKCPICGMDLIPLKTGGADHPRELSVSPSAAKLMQLETAPVERKPVQVDVRMVGKVDYDETRTAFITARVPGRLDRLFIDYTGVQVKQGDAMASIYSPDLLSARQELLQALQSVKALTNSSSTIIRDVSQSTVNSVREKLRLWGLTPEQIREIETQGKLTDHMTIYAPAGGVVVQKNAQEGSYVKTGDRIYTVADLSQVWVQLDAYESDLPWLRDGQKVTFTTEAYPGETFEGTVAFMDPVLNSATRTVNVRVNVSNPELKMKPGMFVHAVAYAPVFETDPLVIPASAPLLTGSRAVVYVEVPGTDSPSYEGRDVELGPKAGDFYVVRSGLSEGERVVVQGAFKLDAELQIQAKPSMMSMKPISDAAPKAQTVCPVLGGEIDKEVFVDYEGMLIYFCCPGCETDFLKDPKMYLEKIRAAGEMPEMLEHHHEQ